MKWRIKYNPIGHGSHFNLYPNWLCWAPLKLFAAHIFARESRSHQKVSAAVFSRGEVVRRGKPSAGGVFWGDHSPRRDWLSLLAHNMNTSMIITEPPICHHFQSYWVSFSVHYPPSCAVICESGAAHPEPRCRCSINLYLNGINSWLIFIICHRTSFEWLWCC